MMYVYKDVVGYLIDYPKYKHKASDRVQAAVEKIEAWVRDRSNPMMPVTAVITLKLWGRETIDPDYDRVADDVSDHPEDDAESGH